MEWNSHFELRTRFVVESILTRILTSLSVTSGETERGCTCSGFLESMDFQTAELIRFVNHRWNQTIYIFEINDMFKSIILVRKHFDKHSSGSTIWASPDLKRFNLQPDLYTPITWWDPCHVRIYRSWVRFQQKNFEFNKYIKSRPLENLVTANPPLSNTFLRNTL